MVDRVRVLNKGLLSTVTQQWRIQERDPGDPASPPPYFWTKLRPQGPKKRLLRPPPPLYLRVLMTALPLI